MPVDPALTSRFVTDFSFRTVDGLPSVSEVVFRALPATTWLVLASSAVLPFLETDAERKPTVLDLLATVVVVLSAVDETFVCVGRLVAATWFAARP